MNVMYLSHEHSEVTTWGASKLENSQQPQAWPLNTKGATFKRMGRTEAQNILAKTSATLV
jgi:hypothetical protein